MSPEAGVSFSVVSRGHGCPPQRPARESVLAMAPEDESLLSLRDLVSGLTMTPWEEVPQSAEPIASQLIRD